MKEKKLILKNNLIHNCDIKSSTLESTYVTKEMKDLGNEYL